MTSETIDHMKERIATNTERAAVASILETMRTHGISLDTLLQYSEELGGSAVTDAQRIQDHRRRTANSNKQLANLAKAREVRKEKRSGEPARQEPEQESPIDFSSVLGNAPAAPAPKPDSFFI